MQQTRTRRQRDVLDFITRYIESHGYEPSYQLVARHLGLKSKSGIAKHVAALEGMGFIERKRENGSFKLALSHFEPAAETSCEIEWLQTPSPDSECDDWERRPIAVPTFLLGGYDPATLFAFRLPDDAMSERNICAGDIALIERRSFVRDGSCVVASVKKTEHVLRNYYRDGSKIELRAANDGFPTIRFPADQVGIQGIFRALLRPAV